MFNLPSFLELVRVLEFRTLHIIATLMKLGDDSSMVNDESLRLGLRVTCKTREGETLDELLIMLKGLRRVHQAAHLLALDREANRSSEAENGDYDLGNLGRYTHVLSRNPFEEALFDPDLRHDYIRRCMSKGPSQYFRDRYLDRLLPPSNWELRIRRIRQQSPLEILAEFPEPYRQIAAVAAFAWLIKGAITVPIDLWRKFSEARKANSDAMTSYYEALDAQDAYMNRIREESDHLIKAVDSANWRDKEALDSLNYVNWASMNQPNCRVADLAFEVLEQR